MKKILSLFLAIMMMVSLFAGCSEEKPEENPENNNESENQSEIVFESLNKTITVVAYDRGEDEAFWNGVKSEFEKANSGVTVNLILSEDAAYEVRDRILGGNSPDVVFLPSDEESGVTNALVKDKAMLALTDIESDSLAPAGAFDNNICKPYEDNVTYIAPIFFERTGLIYNKELLSENGFSVPQTWDDFISVAEACKNKNFSFFTYAGAEPDEFVDIFAAALVPVIGAEEMAKILDCDEEAWKNENIKTFAEKVEKIIKLVVSGSSTKSKEDTMDALKDGKALFVSGTEEDLKELNKDGEKYAICAYPAISGSATNIVSFSEMYIPVEAKEPELAKDFIKSVYMTMSASSSESYASGCYTAEFAEKSAENATLSDEFCSLVVDIFKGNVESDEFAEKMLEHIEEY